MKHENCPFYGVSAVQGLQVNVRTVGTFGIVHYMSAVEGCPLSRVPSAKVL